MDGNWMVEVRWWIVDGTDVGLLMEGNGWQMVDVGWWLNGDWVVEET